MNSMSLGSLHPPNPLICMMFYKGHAVHLSFMTPGSVR